MTSQRLCQGRGHHLTTKDTKNTKESKNESFDVIFVLFVFFVVDSFPLAFSQRLGSVRENHCPTSPRPSGERAG